MFKQPVQLHSFHMLVRLCSKYFKLGFSSTWTENFQMFKLVLEKAKEPEIKLPTSFWSLRKQESSRKTSASAAAAKLLQSCLTLCDPIDGSPSGSSVPGILQARILEWGAISFSSALLTMPKPLIVWITTNYGKFFKRLFKRYENYSRDGNTRPPDLPPEKSVCRSRSKS